MQYLNKYRKSVSWYMRTLEKIIIKTLEKYAIHATTKEDLTGVWVNDEKICAMGVRLSKWVTMHGFALNVNVDLDYFNNIVPCGLTDNIVTSMNKELNMTEMDIKKIKAALKSCFSKTFNSQFI